jgi:hypothetical protein
MAGPAAEFYLDDTGPERLPRRKTSAAQRLRRIERLAWLLDRSIAVGNWRIGIDPILGLLPGVGDALGTLLSMYVVYEGARLGVRGPVLMRMTWNVLLEAIFGAIPVLGDLFDFAWQANTRNIGLIHRHYQPHLKPRSLGWVWAVIVIVAVLLVAFIVFLAYLLMKTTIGIFST